MSPFSRRGTTRLVAASALGLAGWALLSGPAAATPVSTTFAYTGAMQYFTVPSGICQVSVIAQGGQGAGGGGGAIITATVPVPEHDRLAVLSAGAGIGSVGGYGGGGGGGVGGGGGASVVATSTDFALVVAGGGGGNGGVAGYNVGRGPGGSSGSASGNGWIGGGGGGMTPGTAGLGADTSDGPGSVLSAGNGGGGDGTYGGGGGAVPWTYNSAAPDGSNGGYVGSRGGGSADTGGIGSGRGGVGGNTGGRAAGGSGGDGFAGGGAGQGGGGGGGWGGGGGSGWGGDGGNSAVVGTGSNISYSTGRGNGTVTISYNPTTDQCAGTPAAPTDVAVTTGIGSAMVAFTAPSAGASPITSYTVRAIDGDDATRGGQVVTGGSSPLQISGLHAGDHYTFAVTATNAKGAGLESVASAPVVTGNLSGAPTGVAATVRSTPLGTAAVSFTAPAANGGSAITDYIVTAVDTTAASRGGQQQTGTTSPLTVTGLTGGDRYVFVVRATNGLGSSDQSANSNAVVVAAPAATLRITSASRTTFRIGGRHRFHVMSTGSTHARYVEFGALPRGVSFSSAGWLAGSPTPRRQGVYRLTLVAVDGLRTATQSFTVAVVK